MAETPEDGAPCRYCGGTGYIGAPSITMSSDDLMGRLVSPHGFDGRGPVPEEVRQAARRLALLRVKFITVTGPLTEAEVGELFDAAALQAEWMRELYEAVHTGSNAEGVGE